MDAVESIRADGTDNAAVGSEAPCGLPVLQTDGFSAHVDACAWELPAPARLGDAATQPGGGPEPGQQGRHSLLWFVSLLGAQQAVKALWARLVKGERVTLRFPAEGGLETVRFCVLARTAAHGPVSWRLFSASLPFAAGYHAVLAPVLALYGDDHPAFLLLPRQSSAAAALHFRFLNRRVPLPLHPSWAEWLWRRAQRTAEAVALETHGIAAYRCAPNVDALRDDLSAAIRRRQLQVPDD